MSIEGENKNLSTCEKIKTERLISTIKTLINDIVKFNNELAEFIEENKKLTRELFNNVTRYNILDNGLQCEYPIIEKETLLEELLVKIQEHTYKFNQSLLAIREKYDKLPKCSSLIEQQCDQIDWNPVTNFSIKGTSQYKPPSEYLEDIADIFYQYDILITCMQHYSEALNIRDNSSYQNLMNSITISKELSDFVNEFKINALVI